MRFRVPIFSSLSIVNNFTMRLLLLSMVLFSIYFTVYQVLSGQAEESRVAYSAIQARENFRLGVNAFNYGYYNHAIIALEQSLALRPNNYDAISWLGRSYYASGYTRLGLEQWKILIDQNQASASLYSFYNTLNYRYRQVSKLNPPEKYSLFMKIKSNKEAIKRSTYFVGPTSARSSQDRDGIYIVDYRDSKVLIVDSSGAVKNLLRGSLLQVYDHPFDILLRPKGQGFILSQEGTNSLLFCDENGYPYKEIGSKGNGSNHFLGPQHMADTGNGYFYVTDWGNRRVVKLDYDGNFIFTFGSAQEGFPGFQGPSGLVVRNDKIYVGDMIQGKVFVFDQEGQYLDTLIDSGLTAVEDIMVGEEGNLLIADGNRIKLYNFNQSSLKIIYTSDNNNKYIDLNYDRNFNIFAVNFSNEEIDFITPVSNLYTDMFVEINRVITAKYPKISVDIKVEDQRGKSIVGLTKDNFEIMENSKYQDTDLIYSSDDDHSVALAVILGSNISLYQDEIMQIASNIQENDNFMLIEGGRNPRILTDSSHDLYDKLQVYQEETGELSPERNFDISLRFTIDSLIQSRKKKVIVFISGDSKNIASETYNISDLKSYLSLQNANIYAVLSEPNKIFSYLVYNTEGVVDDTEGKLYTDANVRSFTQDLQKNRLKLTGYYTLSYTSDTYTDLARRYIPVEVLVRYVRRSGKDELGFFAPLSSVNDQR